ncbi:MAG: PadR family transcriptional regulator [Holophagales bacterium]|nr:PadR family transcriptional regulator [Holophagales bacterium]
MPRPTHDPSSAQTISPSPAQQERVRGFLPLSPVDCHLLLALSREELYGYALLRAMDEDSGGAVGMDIGALYRALDRLLRDGLIAEADRRASRPTRGKPRRYYRLTEMGSAVLQAEVSRLRRLLALARPQGARG